MTHSKEARCKTMTNCQLIKEEESLKKKMMVSAICKKEDPMNDKKCLCSIVRPPSFLKSILSKLNLDTIIDVITTVANQKDHHYSSCFLVGK